MLSEATTTFSDTTVNVTTHGVRHLGAPLGDRHHTEQFIIDPVETWTAELRALSEAARTQPHLAYSALTHGTINKWVYLSRTVPDISALLQPLEDIMRTTVPPALTDREAPSDAERGLFALSSKLGGLGVINPSELSNVEYKVSKDVSAPLVTLIAKQHQQCSTSSLTEALQNQIAITAAQRKAKRIRLSTQSAAVQDTLPSLLAHAMTLSQEQGASTWLTARPIEEHGFPLHKTAFRDSIVLRYGWGPINLFPLTVRVAIHLTLTMPCLVRPEAFL